jgi:hypothetical protein
MSRYHYCQSDVEAGPVSVEDLRRAFTGRKSGTFFFVRRADELHWAVVRSEEELPLPLESRFRLPLHERIEAILTLMLIVILTFHVGDVLKELLTREDFIVATNATMVTKPMAGLMVRVMALAMFGIGLTAIMCIFWVFKWPFRAVAVGRFLVILFIVAELILGLCTWPHYYVMVPVVREPNPNLLDSRITIETRMPPVVRESNWKDDVAYGWHLTVEFIKHLALCLAFYAIYRHTRGNRPHYGFGDFFNDITFGQLGKRYDWNAIR